MITFQGKNNWQKKLASILATADIKINGNRPWDVQIFDDEVFKRAVKEGPFGWGETYIQGKWQTKELDRFFYKLLQADEAKRTDSATAILRYGLQERIFNLQGVSRVFNIGEKHYDLGNELFQAMLDKSMTYTSGYWKEAENLKEAQEAKLDLVCKKLGLKKGMRVLDIGCGWGNFAKYAAEKYGVEVVGITVSKKQIELGQKMCRGLPVELRYQDYRDVNEKFDHLVSLGMIEHVRRKHYQKYMKVAHQNLKDNGLFLIQTISCDLISRTSKRYLDQLFMYIEKYIFPPGHLPTIEEIGKSIKGLFVMEDLHEFGCDYDKTLMAWHHNFLNNWHKLKSLYDENFYRMWNFFLQACAAGFRTRNLQLYQIVLSKNRKKNYMAVR